MSVSTADAEGKEADDDCAARRLLARGKGGGGKSDDGPTRESGVGDGVLEVRGMRSPRVLRLSIVLGLSRGTPLFGVVGPFENARK